VSKQLEMYLRSVDEFDARVQEMDDSHLSNPTPCSEWDVRALVNHLVYEDRWAVPLLEGKTIADVGDALEGDLVGDDPQLAWKQAAQDAKAAAEAPGAMETTVHLSFGDFSAGDYLDQLTADHVVHAWDLARGTGGNEQLDPELVDYVYAWAAPLEDMLKGSGAYGEKMEAPEGADAQTKLLAVYGRRA